MKLKIFSLFLTFLLFGCNQNKEKSIYIAKNKLIESYSSIDLYNYKDNSINKSFIDESMNSLNDLIELSSSNEKYFYSLMKSRLYLLNDSISLSKDELKSVEKENPLSYNLGLAMINEFDSKFDLAEPHYEKALKIYLSANESIENDIYYDYLNYLIDKDFLNFMKISKVKDIQHYSYLKNKYETLNDFDKIRKSILIDDFLLNYYLPD